MMKDHPTLTFTELNSQLSYPPPSAIFPDLNP